MDNAQLTASNKLLLVLSFLILWMAPYSAHGAESNRSFDPKAVQIHVEHGIELPWGKPGFRIEISGWLPDEALSIQAISPSGETVDLIPVEKPLHADHEGDVIVDIDYARKGLTQGHWMFLIAGKPGVHVFQTDLPLVEAPTASRPTWKLTFGTKREKKD